MKIILFVSTIFFSLAVFSQDRYYTDPVKIPMLLSGSFAELRSNHFHSGIDIKTQGVTGLPVHAAADGYISRIVVSPGGYGKALYINHPNGTTSVYGHLSKFRDDIEKYVRDAQYHKKSFRVNLHLVPGIFPVKKNAVIAHAGNSGSSGGPHLHFEIRDLQTEKPQDPLNFDFPVEDNIPPRLFSLMIAPLTDTSHVNFTGSKKTYSLVKSNGKYFIKNNPVIPVCGQIGFAVQANDYQNGTWNKCGINSMEMFIDDELYFSMEIDEFSFDESRYINSQIVYDEYIKSKNRYMKTWIDPGNKLGIYPYIKGDGSLTTENNSKYKVSIEFKDSYNNKSVLEFYVEHKFKHMEIQEHNNSNKFLYNKSNQFELDNFSINVPSGALYKDLYYKHNQLPLQEGWYFSPIHEIHDEGVPLHKSALIRIKSVDIPSVYHSKALLVRIDTKTGEDSSAGGSYKDGWITSQISSFGSYAIALDTIAPSIVPLSISENSTLSENDRIRFEIEDDLSGIETIEGLLDGKWALFEYDPKNKLITHYFDRERFEFNQLHHLKLTITDYRGNISSYEANFRK